MDRSVTKKLGLLQPGNHADHALLLGNPQAGLESHEVPHPAGTILLAKLHHRVSIATSARITQANWLKWSEAKSVAPALSHHFDWHAALEVRHLVELVAVVLV